MKILDFLFGKAPKIFDKDGSVRHDLPAQRWQAWQDRYLKGEQYNWRNHTGKKAPSSSKNPNKKPSQSSSKKPR